ncbi:hypothetical protein [uncultured Alistipes sp.]|jgi:hypothetical protein|uniref:hypothetical protein n=1 Tax=uncultured Alistipes sp. TaxID=538949 RepID=UPI0025D7B524|nr:hypothetical protein [uncultured Alistipes sp.]
MAKFSKKRFKKWKIGDYIRQFSIVTGGVLLTLWLTGKITESAKQKEVRQAVMLVTQELKDNLQVLKQYKQRYRNEKRIATRLIDASFRTDCFPKDTVLSYLPICSEIGRPSRFQTDALEMFKTSGIASDIADKQQIIDLLRCYNTIAELDRGVELYYDQRKDILGPIFMQPEAHISPGDDEYHAKIFNLAIANKNMQNWIYMLPKFYNDTYFEYYEDILVATISKLEAAY